MKFASIYLQNYIGIYNGMGLNEIFINFTLGTHRTIVIRGDNGSGKSTIMKALSMFPDGNDQFIPGQPAKKEIVLLDGPIVYTLTFIHGVKSNGTRDVTKAYIVKTVNGVSTSLNDNGNVSSYKDILFDEFNLDPNFESLSQLSTDDRGIADKKPADRKRFVNSILNNLEVYNDIYKTLTKHSSNYKNLISSITAKLGSIGDPSVISSNVAGIEAKINDAQDRKDQAIEGLANAKAKVELLDPDGSIQDIINRIEKENQEYQASLDKVSSMVVSSRIGCNISLTDDIKVLIEDTKAKINSLTVDNQIKRGQIESFLRERESEANELSAKLQRLQSFEQDWIYEQICDQIAVNEAAKLEIEKKLSVTGIKDILSFSKESYIAALESIDRIAENISNLRDNCEFSIISQILDDYINSAILPSSKNPDPVKRQIAELEEEVTRYERLIFKYQSDIDVLAILKDRPKECTIDSCPYISKAVIISKSNPKQLYEDTIRTLKITKTKLDELNEELLSILNWNLASTQFNNLIRDIDRGKAISSKLPCWSIFEYKQNLIKSILKGDYTEYLQSIYQYIDLANLFDEYKALDDALKNLYAEEKIYQSKQEIVDGIQADIEVINVKLDSIDKQIVPIQSSLAINDKTIITLQKSLSAYQSISDNEVERDRIKGLLDENNRLYKSNIDKISELEKANKVALKYATMIDGINQEINPLMHERDRLNHQMRLVDDYNRELESLTMQYNTLETIRYYSSPTTGIQLVFMEMYMGKVIQIANNLLSMFFGGQFKILPFIINESEFRIPCAGEGILNDDISSMSSAQIAMISMILSFSFLYNSNSRYNILKLDEIDGPLDATNRIMFIDVLNNVMNMMGTEQCIMISHNTELQEENADIILLKSNDNANYRNGNIIWHY